MSLCMPHHAHPLAARRPAATPTVLMPRTQHITRSSRSYSAKPLDIQACTLEPRSQNKS